MCIICAKAKGVKRPTDKQIDNMMAANPHGFGLATFENGQIVVRKTMDAKQYKEWATAVPKDVPAIYHMRIATHGSISEKNCHPFLSDNGQWAFAHNGILSIKNEGDMTDSETFFRRLAMPLLDAGYLPGSDEFDKMVECVIETSKFAFMDNFGRITLYGKWLKSGKLYFSNSTYEDQYYYPSCYDDVSTWYDDKEYANVNDPNNRDYYDFESYMFDYISYGQGADLSKDELYEQMKAKFPKLKVKTFNFVYDEVQSWVMEYDQEDWK